MYQPFNDSIVSGLPAVFSDVECQFLVEKGIVEVYEKPFLKQEPTKDVKEIFQAGFEKQSQELKQIEDAKLMSRFKDNIEQVVAGRKTHNTRRAKITETMNQDKNKELKETEEPTIEELIKQHEEKLKQTPIKNRIVHIPTAHPFEGEMIRKELVTKDPFKYRVFRDLWQKGYTITSAETFGGDFLCYPGDPLHYHAHQIVILRHKPLSDQELIVHGRTSSIVNKNCVFAFPTENDAVRYETLMWIGPNKETTSLASNSKNPENMEYL